MNTIQASVPQMTIILQRCFTVRRLTQTAVKYIFSESLIIVDYEGIFISIKNLRFSKYSALFLKVQRFTNQIPQIPRGAMLVFTGHDPR